MTDLYATLIGGVSAADRVYSMMEHIPQVRDPASPQLVARPHGELVFDRVGFGYLPDQPVLRDISLRIPFGQTVALIGPNGCGKSTLANLVPRFFDPRPVRSASTAWTYGACRFATCGSGSGSSRRRRCCSTTRS